jgi:hypothetical protein
MQTCPELAKALTAHRGMAASSFASGSMIVP